MLDTSLACSETGRVQNRYAGDVGDFMKLGLLRHLAGPRTAGGAGVSLAVNWYLAPDERHNADGKHVAYLNSGNRAHSGLRACDPDLMRRLTRVVSEGRSVHALEQCGALPVNTRTHPVMIEPGLGAAGRRGWHEGALQTLAGAELVFADPDNGIRTAAGRSTLHKFALVGELADYAERGQAVVAYHHADRSAKANLQARARLGELAAGVNQLPVGAVIARRGTCRFFLVTAPDHLRDRIADSLSDYAARWARHAELITL